MLICVFCVFFYKTSFNYVHFVIDLLVLLSESIRCSVEPVQLLQAVHSLHRANPTRNEKTY